MAVYKIFPEKDSFIYSYYNKENYGRDEIINISSNNDYISRGLIQFSSNEIEYIINKINNKFKTNLKLYLAEANNLPERYTLEVIPNLDNWEMGTGRVKDTPNPRNGSCWDYPDHTNTSITWSNINLVPNIYLSEQEFQFQENKDININVGSIVSDWYTLNLKNYGFLIKLSSTYETDHDISLNYFSSDTHTIYLPHLEFYWNDIEYSSSLPVIPNKNLVSKIINNKGEYSKDDIIQFRINNNELYPSRNFQTSSVYLNNYILPTASFWCVKDVRTNELVIDYNDEGTKIGADDKGSYFNIYMNGLQPERYYEILFKTNIDDSQITIKSSQNIFKIRN